MAAAIKNGGKPIVIEWREVFSHSSPDRGGDVCFAPSPSTGPPLAAARKRKEAEGEFARMPDDELRREIASVRGMRPEFRGLLEGGGRGRLLEDEARRRGIDTAAKDGGDWSRDARSAAKNVFTFDIEDEQVYAASKFFSKLSPIRPTKKNYGQLGLSTHKSFRQVGQRKTIAVDKMYSGSTCSTALSSHKQRVHAVDPEEANNEKYQQNENKYSCNFTKRRKVPHQDSSLLYSQKVQDVVLLDDEDVQPEEPADCGVPDEWNELKIYYPLRDDPEAVELTSSDIKCLDPGVYLSSPVINYYIQYIKKTRLHNEDCRDKFHIFNTYFYGKLQEALLGTGDFSKLRRWWKGVNIFHRGYIILPIHGT